MHQRLCFRIAQPRVELQNLGPMTRHHQARVEKAAEGMPVRAHVFDGRPYDLRDDHRFLKITQDSSVAISAHAAGVGALVAIEDGLVILRRLERQNIYSVAQHDEAHFFTGEEFFDHQNRTRR